MILGVVLYIVTGAVTGLLAGLLGVGGGIVVVPSLAYIYRYLDMPSFAIMHMAVSTSLAAMIFTTAVAVILQHRRGNIVWSTFYRLAPGIVLGTVFGAYIASSLPTHLLKLLFGAFMVLIAARMLFKLLFPKPEEIEPAPPALIVQLITGLFIGLISGMLGIGGGAITVPVLLYFGLSPHKSAATSSICAFLLSIVGTISFIITGWSLTGLPAGSTGYVYWPAALSIALASILFVPLGAKLARKLSGDALKRIFSIFLLLVGLDMLIR